MSGPVEPSRAGRAYALATMALYAIVVVVYVPSLAYAPIAIDDRSQLAHVAGKSFSALLIEGDRFGHFRPLKNLLFAWLGEHPGRVALLRVLLLALVLGTAALLQRVTWSLTRAPWVALAAAALWALHPTTASTVCWLSTANLGIALPLMLVYLLVASRGQWEWALVSLALALSAHELALLTPLLGWAYLRARARPVPSLRTPLAIGSLLLVGAYGALQLLREAPSHAYRSDGPAWRASFGAARYFVTHLALWLWPRGSFGVLRTDPPDAHLVANVACWGALLGAGALAVRLRGRDRTLDFAMVWVVLTLLPVCNLIPFGNTPIALHYLSIPGVGLALAVSQGIARGVAKLPRRRLAIGCVAAALCGALLLPETVTAVRAWENEETLYLATLENHPDEPEVLSNLGSLYLGADRYAEARPLLARAYAIAPSAEGVLINGFALELATNHPDAALALLDAHPERAEQAEFAIRRGEALERLGRDAEAAAAFGRGYQLAATPAQRDQRYIGGYRRMVVLVRLDRAPEAEALLARLMVEFPDREELQIAHRLLHEQ